MALPIEPMLPAFLLRARCCNLPTCSCLKLPTPSNLNCLKHGSLHLGASWQAEMHKEPGTRYSWVMASTPLMHLKQRPGTARSHAA